MSGMETGPLAPAEAGGMLQKLKWLTGLRLLLTSALLGSAFVLDMHERLPFRTAPLYVLLCVTFGLSLLYALGLRKQRFLVVQGLVQLALDLVLVSLLVHFTGGLDSAFAFLYIFVIFAAANLLGRRGSFVVAALSSGLYGGLIVAEWTQIIRPVEFAGGLAPVRPAGYAIYQVLIHAVAFLAVAILSSHLVERLRQTGQELEQRGLDLRNLQNLHGAIVANISSGILTLDLAGRVIAFNGAAERITGVTFQDLRDRPWQSTPFAACSTLTEFFANPNEFLVTPATELYVKRGDGRAIPVGIACSPLRGEDGKPVGVVAIFQDLTEKKQAEEQLRRADRLAALGQLAANIAHEIRNPLAAISGSVEVLQEDLTTNEPSRELLGIILREARRLKLITGQFLDFAKPQPLLFRPCRLRPLIEETLSLLAKSSEHPKMSWSLKEELADLQVLADSDQLRQVVWNLSLNAVQAMPDGGHITVSLRPVLHVGRTEETTPSDQGTQPTDGLGRRAAPTPRSEEWVEIEFQDTGRGIPAGELGRVFDPFFTTRPSGTGLGLAIARKILESMDGRIGVTSRPNFGTTFFLWLRRAPVIATAETGSRIGGIA